ncbi:MAG: 16S rRNA (adenine(1518)-N(6)/adenine(1519)-N(6))-dimethyltransferase RsmA [Gammaproteobacteria bacterium]|nr:16S rRNA (adenine(1518)-N(6)/adenine(1519)-N(6))-dimethyltransferase RsmA [Gammaproteobacteria bacterium]MDH5799579.1 16S rRNA (adenine(1518)-N(6)/adenine(1519)-N(6))-dimethyltransferase RsmA [Gammaproteobacteria bacterium]
MSQSHRARKRFGQHFLTDGHTVAAIVHAIHAKASDHIVEIGPGLGALTQELLPLVQRMDAVELDRDVIPKLKQLCLPLGKLTIHSADALQFDFCQLQTNAKLRVVGNLPYNISTPLIFRLVEQSHCVEDMHFMLQKEVVDRMAAAPACSDYGKLSVMLQYFCEVESLFEVPPSAFSPPPKVNSAVVRLRPFASPPLALGDVALFERVVTQAFSQRRKTLRNTLKSLIGEQELQLLEIDPVRRAETLTLEEFAVISRYLEQNSR